MLNQYKFNILDQAFYFGLVFFSLFFQTQFWPQYISNNVIPQLWFIFVAYFAVNKNPIQNILMIYFTSIIYSSSTSMHFGKLLLLFSTIYLIACLFRPLDLKTNRIYFIFCLVFLFSIPLIDLTLTIPFAFQIIHPYSILNWIQTSLITILFLMIMTFFFSKFDQWIQTLKINQESQL